MEERGSHFCAEACVRRGEMKAEEEEREKRAYGRFVEWRCANDHTSQTCGRWVTKRVLCVVVSRWATCGLENNLCVYCVCGVSMPARTPRAPLGIALERAGGGMERVSCVCVACA